MTKFESLTRYEWDILATLVDDDIQYKLDNNTNNSVDDLVTLFDIRRKAFNNRDSMMEDEE